MATVSDSFPVLEYAQKLVAAGISVIPIRVDAPKKPALPTWEPFETRLPTPRELDSWFRGRQRGIAAIGGSVSGGLECLDFDEPGLFDHWADELDLLTPGLLHRLVVVKTPKGGAHVWFRSPGCEPSQVLAQRPPTPEESREKPRSRWYKRIETRGAGGYALLPGSPAECHERLKPYEYSKLGRGDLLYVETLSLDERQQLVGLCRSFNTYAAPQKPLFSPASSRSTSLTPGDDFDRRGDWQAILEPCGWKLEKGDWNNGRLTRPGKDLGVSATIGACRGKYEEPLLYVFSTSTELPAGTYGRFRAYALLHHHNNLSAAAKALAAKGFGNARIPKNEDTFPATTEAEELICRRGNGRMAEDEDYLVEGKIPAAKLSMIAGVGGAGKSSLIRHLIARLTTGRPALGLDYKPPPPCDVLLASVEDKYEAVLPHFIAEGANCYRIHTIEGVRRHGKIVQFTLADVHLISQTVRANPDIRLLIIDPIMSFVGRAKVNENASAEVRTVLDPLIDLTNETGISVLLIAHLNKATNMQAVNRIAGAAAFRDTCRVVLAYGVDPDHPDRRILADVKSNLITFERGSLSFSMTKLDREQLLDVFNSEECRGLSPQGVERLAKHLSVVTCLGPSDCDADGIVGAIGGNQANNETQIGKCVEWLRQFLSTYAFPSAEIDEAGNQMGFSPAVIAKAKARLGKNGTQEIKNWNFGNGRTHNDFWSGTGQDHWNWIRRPAEEAIPLPSQKASESSGSSDSSRSSESFPSRTPK